MIHKTEQGKDLKKVKTGINKNSIFISQKDVNNIVHKQQQI